MATKKMSRVNELKEEFKCGGELAQELLYLEQMGLRDGMSALYEGDFEKHEGYRLGPAKIIARLQLAIGFKPKKISKLYAEAYADGLTTRRAEARIEEERG